MLKKLVKLLDNRYNNNVIYTRSQMIQRDVAMLWLVLAAVTVLLFVGYLFVTSAALRTLLCFIGGFLMTLWALSTLCDE